MKLTCDNCGVEKTFENERAAFMDGWDFPPASPVTTCGQCPSAPLFLEKKDKRPVLRGGPDMFPNPFRK